MKGLILILGAPNDEKGNLSDISIGRVEKGIETFNENEGYKILCTGGFGDHFNTTDQPHAAYVKKYLLEHEIPAEAIVEFAKSHDTEEDALLAKPIIDKYGVKSLIIISSDFHIGRVQYIFEKVFGEDGYQLEFREAETDFPEERYDILLTHEKKELERLEREGIKSMDKIKGAEDNELSRHLK